MEKELSPIESLSIIKEMIESTKQSMSDSSHYFLLWGYAVFLGCSIQYILLKLGYENHSNAWLIILIALVFHFIFLMRDKKKRKVSTFVGEANGYLWMGIGFCFMISGFIFSKIGWQHSFPLYILFYALGTFVSGNLLKFKPLIIGGSICFALAAVVTFVDYDLQILITAISVLISYIIPGHLLRMQYQKQTAKP